MTETATTFRDRLRQYWDADELPHTPEGTDVPRWKRISGLVLVTVIAFVVVSPLAPVIGIVNPMLPIWAQIALPILWFLLATKAAQYVGGPVADHVLDIPREVEN